MFAPVSTKCLGAHFFLDMLYNAALLSPLKVWLQLTSLVFTVQYFAIIDSGVLLAVRRMASV